MRPDFARSTRLGWVERHLYALLPILRVSKTTNEMPITSFAPLSARRLLVLGGIALILIGMLFGDIFAVFVLHQNASRVGASLASAAHAALAGDTSLVDASFQDVGSFLENRGTKVDTHVHAIDFGYLALLLAILLPWIAFSEATKQRLAWLFLIGAILLPVGVFLIHYVGLAYSPLPSIGWASIFADLGGLLVLIATLRVSPRPGKILSIASSAGRAGCASPGSQ